MQNVTRELAVEDDEGTTGWRGLTLLLLVSVAAHAALFGGLGRPGSHAGIKSKRRPPTQVRVDVAPPKPAPPPPEAPKEPPKTAARRVAVRAPAPPAEKAPPPPPPEAESPADFSGTTLTNDGPGPGWASAVGNGEAMRGPIGRPGAKKTDRVQEGAPAPSKTAAPVVALASLSRPPEPPDLNGALERNYPGLARKQGTPGQAVLKARVTAEGKVANMVVVSESGPGFGEACRATLRDSVWSAPLDKEGNPVATFITYTCRFEVR